MYEDTTHFGVGIACAENVEESFIVARYLVGSQSSKIAETKEPIEGTCFVPLSKCRS